MVFREQGSQPVEDFRLKRRVRGEREVGGQNRLGVAGEVAVQRNLKGVERDESRLSKGKVDDKKDAETQVVAQFPDGQLGPECPARRQRSGLLGSRQGGVQCSAPA